MKLRGLLLTIILSLAAFTVLASIPGPNDAPAVTPRRLLETMALIASLVVVITWISAAVAAWRRGGSWSWREMSREQRLGLLLSVSMTCLFTGMMIGMVLPPRPWVSIVSGVLVTASIPGNLVWIRAHSATQRGGTCRRVPPRDW